MKNKFLLVLSATVCLINPLSAMEIEEDLPKNLVTLPSDVLKVIADDIPLKDKLSLLHTCSAIHESRGIWQSIYFLIPLQFDFSTPKKTLIPCYYNELFTDSKQSYFTSNLNFQWFLSTEIKGTDENVKTLWLKGRKLELEPQDDKYGPHFFEFNFLRTLPKETRLMFLPSTKEPDCFELKLTLLHNPNLYSSGTIDGANIFSLINHDDEEIKKLTVEEEKTYIKKKYEETDVSKEDIEEELKNYTKKFIHLNHYSRYFYTAKFYLYKS